MKRVKLFEEFINEATTSWAKMMKGVKSGDSGPWSLVAHENGKVVGQHNDIIIKDMLPAHFEALRKEYPRAKIHIEDGGGMVVWNESNEFIHERRDITDVKRGDILIHDTTGDEVTVVDIISSTKLQVKNKKGESRVISPYYYSIKK